MVIHRAFGAGREVEIAPWITDDGGHTMNSEDTGQYRLPIVMRPPARRSAPTE